MHVRRACVQLASALVGSGLLALGPLAAPASAAEACPAFVAVDGGTQHTIALGSDGTVWTWGGNSYGEIGYGTVGTAYTSPGKVPGLSGVTAVSAGAGFSLALTSAGAVYAWGHNQSGQLGDGTTTDRHTPTLVPGLTGVTAIAAGGFHALAITAGGAVVAWGDNGAGQVGDGSAVTIRTSPVPVSGITAGATAIAAGYVHSLAVVGGAAKSWGGNDHGGLGDGTTVNRGTPVQVSGLTTGVTAVSAGWYYSLALTVTGSVKSWGYGSNGRLGDGWDFDRTTPVQVSGLTSGVAGIAAGSNNGYAFTATGAAKSWGYGGSALGNGTWDDAYTPVQVSGLTSGVTSMGAGSNVAGAIHNGVLKMWGVGGGGAVGHGSFTSAMTPVLVDCGFAPSTTSANDTPDPVLAGSTVTFSVGWTDPNAGQAVRAVICKTNAVSAGSCPGGAWAVGALGSTTPATASYPTTDADIGTRDYYAFACDAAGQCSTAGLARTFTVNASNPSATATTETPDPVAARNTITFQVSWSDPNVGEQAKALACKTNAVSAGTCPGGAWATGSLTSATPATATYATTSADVGTRTYYAFVCDSTNRCSAGVTGTFTVTTGAPAATSASAAPDPVAAPHPVTFSVGWTDPNPTDQARAVICKTNAVSAGSCPGGAWATGGATSASPATATYATSDADVGVHDYFAFVCDSVNLCSASIAGSFEVTPSTECDDGVDNDTDGKTDYPADPGCASPADDNEGAGCEPVTTGVVVCLTPATEVARYPIEGVGTSAGEPRDVAGYVDLYQFVVADVSVNLPCVHLTADGTTVNPCALAGGTFLDRIAVLTETPVPDPEVVDAPPLATVAVCTAELTATVFGIGIGSAPAYTLC